MKTTTKIITRNFDYSWSNTYDQNGNLLIKRNYGVYYDLSSTDNNLQINTYDQQGNLITTID